MRILKIPEAAAQLQVSPRLIDTAKKVIRDAAPNVQTAVREGQVSLNTASQIATLPQSEQRRLRDPPQMLARAAELRVVPHDDIKPLTDDQLIQVAVREVRTDIQKALDFITDPSAKTRLFQELQDLLDSFAMQFGAGLHQAR